MAHEMRIGLQLAQEELAQLLGASRQRVNQELKSMEREDAIRIETRRAGGAQPGHAHCASPNPKPDRAAVQPVHHHRADGMSDTQSFTGTRPVSDQHAFDQDALAAWLRLHLPGFEGPMSVEMFKGGQIQPDLQADHPPAVPM